MNQSAATSDIFPPVALNCPSVHLRMNVCPPTHRLPKTSKYLKCRPLSLFLSALQRSLPKNSVCCSSESGAGQVEILLVKQLTALGLLSFSAYCIYRRLGRHPHPRNIRRVLSFGGSTLHCSPFNGLACFQKASWMPPRVGFHPVHLHRLCSAGFRST